MHFAVPTPGDGCRVRTSLNGSEGDARVMAAIARDAGFWVWKPLVGKGVTRSAVLGSLRAASRILTRGDMLIVTYSGHGSQEKTTLNDPERDGYDETWCLADGQLIDNDLHRELAAFETGVRILVISESCHSGGIASRALPGLDPAAAAAAAEWVRFRSEVIAARVAQHNVSAQLARHVLPRRADRVPIHADVLLLAACSDEEGAEDRVGNSLFTGELLKVWTTVPQVRTYEEFIVRVHDRVAIESNGLQHPGIALFGGKNPAFPAQRPFTI